MTHWAEGYVRGPICPKCEGKKSYGAWICWRCAGHKEPTPGRTATKEDMARSRTLTVLRRDYDREGFLTDEGLIAVGQSKTDDDLLRLRNFGRISLRWLRSLPVAEVAVPTTKDDFVPLSISGGEWIDYLGAKVINYTKTISTMLREASALLEEEDGQRASPPSWEDDAEDLVKRIKQTFRENVR